MAATKSERLSESPGRFSVYVWMESYSAWISSYFLLREEDGLDPLKEHLWSFRSSALLEQGCDLAPVGLLRRGARCVRARVYSASGLPLRIYSLMVYFAVMERKEEKREEEREEGGERARARGGGSLP
eukprot:768763-Hanusia_phi.AAC.3